MAKYTASDGTEFDTKREWRKYEFELSFTFKNKKNEQLSKEAGKICLLYTSPSPRDRG